ncbi:hypothetical protein F5B22DRAFT_614209 [Xylaria bambusicola]|uniref:uncharacterized protein n=1 Tax=Xylaria bambusicola TaxID=326684 RepID=UPI002008895D|nr:uncharacterized protein F5B22DRAFT_614209 [Xylaria bambusicola]KAI0512785.1 hypothetical protein F5B22DRAFT_614209 [Xylaria bambusicola]
MRFTTATALATLATLSSAAKSGRTFAVLRFDGDGFLTEGPMDPVVSPGIQSSHYHSIMGGSNFGATVEGNQLLDSDCTTAKIKNDKSNYWVPALFFQDPKNGTFQKVPLFYMNVYYFFEATDDEIVAFPPGLKMLVGDANTRAAPKSGGALNLDPDNGVPINPVQWTCPRSSYNPASYPVNSDGSTAGMVDPNNKGSGAGFPLYPCDGYASPLRQDIHFPSCYNETAGLDNHKGNMLWPHNEGFKQNCPAGTKHVPHMFIEVYWNTPLFDDLWTPDGKNQPFVLSNGDATGYSSHADFIAGWETNTLQTIIDTCDAGDAGMDQCPQIPGGLNDNKNCKIKPNFGNILNAGQVLTDLPVVGKVVTGWGKGGVSGGSVDPPTASKASSSQAADATPVSSSPAETEAASTATYKEHEASSTVEAEATKSAPGGAFIESSSTSVAAVETPATTPAATPAADTDTPGSYPEIKTIWDIVTVTLTTTVPAPEPTQGLHRRAPKHSHGHAARHLGSFAARR